MNAIDALFQKLRTQGRKAFIPFVTAGDPNLDTSARLVAELAGAGASLIEIGFPYSDPIADGSVIQASYTRALANQFRLDDIFAMVRGLKVSTPLACMLSYSLVHRRGSERFLADAQQAGFSGAIVPDLPIDEADALVEQAARRDFKLIQLVTPTTPRDRAARIARASTGFLYCVSVVGITGTRRELPPELLDHLRWLRTQTSVPLCVGFGVSTPAHVQRLREAADGVIVGSALVRRLEEVPARGVDQVIADITAQARELIDALNA